MDPSVFGPPYRPPCGGWPAKARVGAVIHYRLGDKTDYWKNTTQVAKHDGTSGTEAPHPRPDDELSWPAATQPGSNCPCDPGTGCAQLTPHGAPYTGPWSASEFPACPAGSGLGTYDLNCYAKQGGQVDYGVWRKVGFKGAQAMRWWHGMYRLLSHEPSGRPDRQGVSITNAAASPDNNYVQYTGATSTCANATEDEQPAADRTKYLALTVTAEVVHTDSAYPANNYDETYTVSASVAAQSGVTTASIPADTTHGARSRVKVYRPGDAATMYALSAHVLRNGFVVGPTVYATVITETSTDGITWSWQEQDYVWDATLAAYSQKTAFTQTLNVQTGEYHSVTYGWNAAGTGWVVISTVDLAIADTVSTYTAIGYTYGSGYTWTYKVVVTSTLSGPNTAGAIWTDIKWLLALWPLNDDKLYPWRVDSYVTSGPLVGRNEVQAPVSPESAIGNAPGWTDPSAATCDGSITGAPLSYYLAGGAMVGGYGPHFDWRHKTWWGCVDGAENPVSYIGAYGAWSGAQPGHASDRIACGDPTDDNQPPGATRWLENYPWPGLLPPGAWAMSAPAVKQWAGGYDGDWITTRTPGLFLAQKWAEIKIPRPSHNFFRPCGLDRYELDTGNVHCVSSAAGSPLIVTLTAAATFSAGDVVVYNPTTGMPALYTVASGSGTVWTMSAKLRDLPANTAYPAGTLSKLRWYTAAWPICGRIGVASATDNGAGRINMVLAAPATALQTGDSVDFTGLPFTGAATALAATVVDATHLSVSGAFSGSYVSGGYMASHGAPNYEWNDANAKGDYLVISWTQNQRDYQERARVIAQWAAYPNCHWSSAPGSPIRANQRLHGMPSAVTAFEVTQDCLPFTGCCPQVICISPNGETWLNGKTYWADETAIAAGIGDDRYGYIWQGVVQQDMPDPLWRPPKAPCTPPGGTACQWLEDADGLCLADVCSDGVGGTGGKRYFAHRPMKEARNGGASIGADNSPALPSGCYLGYLPLAALDTTGSVSGLVLPPPQVAEDAGGTLRLEGFGYDASTAGVLWPGTPITPWELWLHEANCVCNETRADFAPIYQLDAVPKCL